MTPSLIHWCLFHDIPSRYIYIDSYNKKDSISMGLSTNDFNISSPHFICCVFSRHATSDNLVSPPPVQYKGPHSEQG